MSGELQGQVLEIFLGVVLICCILIGSNRGLLLSLYNVVKNLLIIAATIGIAPVIVKRLPDTLTAKEGIAYIIALFVAVIVFNIVAHLLQIIGDAPVLGGLNKLGGAFFGVITGIFVVWSILALLGALQKVTKVIMPAIKASHKAARGNDRVMWFQNCNPIPSVLKRFDFPVL